MEGEILKQESNARLCGRARCVCLCTSGEGEEEGVLTDAEDNDHYRHDKEHECGQTEVLPIPDGDGRYVQQGDDEAAQTLQKEQR